MKNLEFNPIYLPVMESSHFYKILYGGRGSGKSYFVSDFLVILLASTPGRNLLALRKTKTHVRGSVFMGLLNSIQKLGLSKSVKVDKTTMVITFRNKNQIKCEGLDNAVNLKSMNFENGCSISDVWFEEAEQLSKADMETIDFSVRKGDPPQVILTFNPINKNMWIYKEFIERQALRGDTFVLRTSYLDNKFISEHFVKRMEALKRADPERYNVVGLGNFGNVEGIVYKNYKVQKNTHADEWFDSICYGFDFGFNDPMALVKLGFKDSCIYVLDELYVNNVTGDQFADLMELQGIPKTAPIYCDHQKEYIATIERHGYTDLRLAQKKNKEKWIYHTSSHNIYIDPKCENILKEIGVYKWIMDPSGRVLNKVSDGFDHALDAMLYGARPWVTEKMMVSPEVSW